MTVQDLITLLTSAYSMHDKVYVETSNDDCPIELEDVDRNSYGWGFVIGKVDAE